MNGFFLILRLGWRTERRTWNFGWWTPITSTILRITGKPFQGTPLITSYSSSSSATGFRFTVNYLKIFITATIITGNLHRLSCCFSLGVVHFNDATNILHTQQSEIVQVGEVQAKVPVQVSFGYVTSVEFYEAPTCPRDLHVSSDTVT